MKPDELAAARAGYFKVESGIPIPPKNATGGGAARQFYPWARMKVGDSFFVPADATRTPRDIECSLTSNATKKRYGEFVTRQRVERHVLGVRCWRVK